MINNSVNANFSNNDSFDEKKDNNKKIENISTNNINNTNSK